MALRAPTMPLYCIPLDSTELLTFLCNLLFNDDSFADFCFKSLVAGVVAFTKTLGLCHLFCFVSFLASSKTKSQDSAPCLQLCVTPTWLQTPGHLTLSTSTLPTRIRMSLMRFWIVSSISLTSRKWIKLMKMGKPGSNTPIKSGHV